MTQTPDPYAIAEIDEDRERCAFAHTEADGLLSIEAIHGGSTVGHMSVRTHDRSLHDVEVQREWHDRGLPALLVAAARDLLDGNIVERGGSDETAALVRLGNSIAPPVIIGA
jgi:hypothetical protein